MKYMDSNTQPWDYVIILSEHDIVELMLVCEFSAVSDTNDCHSWY